MIYSMTGYGRAELTFKGEKIVVEIRSVNGKGADINLKGAMIPKSKEPEIRQLLVSHLQRGSIDLYVYIEGVQMAERPINKGRFMSYYRQIKALQKEIPELELQGDWLSAILRIPEVIELSNQDPDEKQWAYILQGINKAIQQVILFRAKEGVQLLDDILHRVELIESYVLKVEDYEKLRIEGVKERLKNRLTELMETVQLDQNRFEQELIYYLEKMDITEEKVRLRHHCVFFKQSLLEENQGRKLSFITQEMGREINTMGSKANHAVIQQLVVKMKDELEKIKEQLLNIL
jgi:uncharacterized protein (TIGR00255 family)